MSVCWKFFSEISTRFAFGLRTLLKCERVCEFVAALHDLNYYYHHCCYYSHSYFMQDQINYTLIALKVRRTRYMSWCNLPRTSIHIVCIWYLQHSKFILNFSQAPHKTVTGELAATAFFTPTNNIETAETIHIYNDAQHKCSCEYTLCALFLHRALISNCGKF